MNALDIIFITLLGMFAAACIITAIVSGAWWHCITGAMFASLAGAWYEEEKPE